MALEGLQLGQYRLLHLLGSGGMGEVYLAEDARISQQVAIKISRSEATAYPKNSTAQDVVRLFQREAKAIARLDHPHILPLFSYGEENINGMTLIYIVMPYRREGSFINWLQQRGANELLSVQDVAYFISQAADALQYAHENQIVHQDVKPSNFLIRTNKGRSKLPDLLLADFGIARLSASTSSASHAIRGTPTYMAPEQWSGEPVYATDQYALAILAYELLSGRSPFVGRQEQVMYQHFNVPPQPPSTFNPQLSKDVDAVILKALAKQAENRFLSISAFANAFQEATLGLDASTILKAPYTPKSSDLQATLAISKAEAQTGTNRVLTLPGGRRVSVPVLAGAYDGQILRLPGMGEPSNDGGPAGTLILTLSVQETAEIAPPAQGDNLNRTLPASNPNTPDKTALSPNRSNASPVPPPSSLVPNAAEAGHPQPVARQQGISTGTAILLVGLALLIIVGGLGFFYLYNSNRSSSNTTSSITNTQNGEATSLAATSTTQANSATSTAQANSVTATVQANNATAQVNNANATATANTSNTPVSSNYVQLKSYYSGTASGYADGNITFTLKSEDQQGNLSMQTTFQQAVNPQKTAFYSCQGSVTTDRYIKLQCNSDADQSYVLTIQGYVYADGHMEGTERATITNDSSYDHLYSWKAY
ncbi:MAG: serine/threonine protein kinase [Ktedonobacteraceae bacterium]